MRATIIVWLGLLLLIAGCGGQARSATQPPLPVTTPEPAYNFTLKTLTGDVVSLEDFRGKWVLLNFWATWCVPCAKEMPYLQQIAAEGDMVVLGVNFNESPATVEKFVKEHNLTFPVLMEPDDVILTMYKVRALPRTFVISPDGRITHQIIGEIVPEQFDSWREQNIIPDSS